MKKLIVITKLIAWLLGSDFENEWVCHEQVGEQYSNGPKYVCAIDDAHKTIAIGVQPWTWVIDVKGCGANPCVIISQQGIIW